jgi:hypothetical protein
VVGDILINFIETNLFFLITADKILIKGFWLLNQFFFLKQVFVIVEAE